MTIDDIIASAAEELGCDYSTNEAWFTVLIHDAVTSMRTSNNIVVKSAVVKSYDGKIKLPDDCVILMEICGYCNYTACNNVISFPYGDSPEDDTEITVRYKGFNVDDKGMIIIDDRWARMLIAYIGWKYTRKYPQKYPPFVMNDFKREFQTQKLANS